MGTSAAPGHLRQQELTDVGQGINEMNLLHPPPRDSEVADQPAVPCMLLLAQIENGGNVGLFPTSRELLVCPGISKMIKSSLAMTPASSPTTLGHMPSAPMDLCVPNWLQCPPRHSCCCHGCSLASTDVDRRLEDQGGLGAHLPRRKQWETNEFPSLFQLLSLHALPH